MIGNNKNYKDKKFTVFKISFTSLIFKNFIPTSSVMISSNIKEKFLEEYYAEDYHLWLSILNKYKECYFIDDYLCEELNVNKDINLSNNTKEVYKNVQIILNKFFSKNILKNIFIIIAKIYYYLKAIIKKYLN